MLNMDILKIVFVMAVMSLMVGTAAAGPLTISYSTWGSFSPYSPDILSYTSTTYTGTIDLGQTVQVDLGTVNLEEPTGLEPLNGDSMTLGITFAPSVGVTEPVVYDGTLHGTVSDTSNSAIQVHFNPDDTQVINFSTPDAAGTFLLSVDNVQGLRTDGSQPVTGSLTLTSIAIPGASAPSLATEAVTAAAIPNPEPVTSVLMGSALVGLSILARRSARRSK